MRIPLLWNPIVAKEYRSRMRTWRSPLAITVYVLLLGGLGWLVFGASSASASGNVAAVQTASSYGRTLFIFLIIFQLLLLAFITPALTAGAISGERERQTIDLLFCTRVKPFAILWGKLLASMSFVLVLLVVSVPIFSLVFLFGGIELDQVLTAFAVTAVAALTLGTLGLFFSTILPRTLTSTVAAYGAAFVLLFGTLLIAVLRPTEYDSQSAAQAPAPPAISYLSPITPLAAIVGSGTVFQPMLRPKIPLPYRVQGGPAFPGRGLPIPVAVPAAQTDPSIIPSGLFSGWRYWQANVVLSLAISAVALILSAVILPPVRRFPFKRIAGRVAA